MKRLSIWTKLFMGLVAFSLAGTLLTRLTGLDPGPVKPVASFLTILIGFVALARLVKLWQAAAVLLVGATAELFGVYTGYPFGEYSYSTRWWPSVQLPQSQTFPLLVPFAWFLVAGGCALALRPLGKQMLILAPLMAALLDFFMEPVMTHKLGYWRWTDPGPLPGGAPWLNVLGWLCTSFLAAWIVRKGGKDSGPEATWVLVAYVILIGGLWAIG